MLSLFINSSLYFSEHFCWGLLDTILKTFAINLCKACWFAGENIAWLVSVLGFSVMFLVCSKTVHECDEVMFCWGKSCCLQAISTAHVRQWCCSFCKTEKWRLTLSPLRTKALCGFQSVSHRLQCPRNRCVSDWTPGPLPGENNFPLNKLHLGKKCSEIDINTEIRAIWRISDKALELADHTGRMLLTKIWVLVLLFLTHFLLSIL